MKSFLPLAICLVISFIGRAQIFISANPNDTIREPSAMFEVRSSERGFLPPRMSSSQRKSIVNPAPGLMVFDTTKQLFYGFTKGLGWRPFSMGFDTAYLSEPFSPVNLIDNQQGDNLGTSVAIRGKIAVAGAIGDNVNGKAQQGSIYVFNKNGTSWDNVQKLTASDGGAGDLFGNHLAITDSFVMVAAYHANVGENLNQGAVYVYKIQGDSLVFHQKIVSLLAAANDYFGSFIRASGNDLFIGAPYDDIQANSDQGALYYFALENNTWVEKQKIIQDSAASSMNYFGYGMSISGNWVAVGAEINSSGNYGLSQNAVFLYEKVNGLWQRRQKINQPDDLSGKTDAFGYATYLQDSILTIGAWLKDEPSGNKDRGAAYIFKKTGNNWNFVKKFAPADPNPNDTYGDYFAGILRGDGKYLITGNGHEDIGAGSIDKGAFFIYEWVSNDWVLKRKIASPTPTTLDLFGHRCDIRDGNIIVSAGNAFAGKGMIYFYSLED